MLYYYVRFLLPINRSNRIKVHKTDTNQTVHGPKLNRKTAPLKWQNIEMKPHSYNMGFNEVLAFWAIFVV